MSLVALTSRYIFTRGGSTSNIIAIVKVERLANGTRKLRESVGRERERERGRGRVREEVNDEGRKGACRTAVEFPGMKIILECPDGGGLGKFSDSSNSCDSALLRIESFRRGSFVSRCTFKTTRQKRREKNRKRNRERKRDPLPYRSTLVKILSLFELASRDEGNEERREPAWFSPHERTRDHPGSVVVR